jgi:hypothetical protein
VRWVGPAVLSTPLRAAVASHAPQGIVETAPPWLHPGAGSGSDGTPPASEANGTALLSTGMSLLQEIATLGEGEGEARPAQLTTTPRSTDNNAPLH